MSSRLGKSTEQVHALTVYACHTHEYPLYSRETTSFPSIIIQQIQVLQGWVPYDWETHIDENEQYCRKNHNACFLTTVTNTRPYYALLSCKNIANCQGGNHPGLLWPSFRFSPWTVRDRKSFHVELLSSLRGPATSCSNVYCQRLDLYFWYYPVLREPNKHSHHDCLPIASYVWK